MLKKVNNPRLAHAQSLFSHNSHNKKPAEVETKSTLARYVLTKNIGKMFLT